MSDSLRLNFFLIASAPSGWLREITLIGLTDSFTQRIVAQQPVQFRGKQYSPEQSQSYSTEHSEAKLERDPKEKHRFMLKIDGVSVFQWFRIKAKEFLAKLGIRPKESKRGHRWAAKTIVTGSIIYLGGLY